MNRLSRIVRSIPQEMRFNRQEAFFGAPRKWSNRELRKIARLFSGPVINVSGWADEDKEGGRYRDYFGSDDYWISNFGTAQGEMQGWPNELYLDLAAPLTDPRQFATVFNHTTLEHVWNFGAAFSNLCALSSDAVIVVVPWLQPMHTEYGDYWRFSPQAVVRLFEEEGFTPVHLVWNHSSRQSVYILAVGVRDARKWAGKFPPLPINGLELPSNIPGGLAFG